MSEHEQEHEHPIGYSTRSFGLPDGTEKEDEDGWDFNIHIEIGPLGIAIILAMIAIMAVTWLLLGGF